MRFYSIIFFEKRILAAMLLLGFQLLSLQSSAQSESFSPYSRYGIGDIPFNGFVKNMGMGGTGIAERPLYNINSLNPASHSSLVFTEFDIAVTSTFTKLSTASLSQKKSGTTFSYFAIGFPVINKIKIRYTDTGERKDTSVKKWGAAIGLVPFSNVGYKMVSPVADPNAGNINYTYEGTGGVNRILIGNAVNLKKNFSAGFNASYLFGSIDRISKVEFSEANFFNSRFTTNTLVGGFYFDFGLQHVFDSLDITKSDSMMMYDKTRKNLKDSIEVLKEVADSLTEAKNTDSAAIKLQMDVIQKNISELRTRLSQTDSARRMVKDKRQRGDWSLTSGLTFALPTNISASQDFLIERYQGNANFISIQDTVLLTEGEEGDIRFPLTLGFGLSLKKGTRWLIGADVSMQNWDDYSYFGQKDSLRNSLRVSSGFQFTPKERGSYFEEVQYRFGAFYNQTYLQLKGTQLNEYGLTAGLGLPIESKGFNFATVHLSAAFGTRGTIDNNLLKEDFARISIGITFNERWFIKPKFD